MPEIGKIELDDDELDKVSGGATATQIVNCNDYTPVDTTKPKTCSNCALHGIFCDGK